MIPKEVLKKVHQIEIRTTGIVNSVLAGAYSSSFKGQGMEFAEVREYVPGDEQTFSDGRVPDETTPGLHLYLQDPAPDTFTQRWLVGGRVVLQVNAVRVSGTTLDYM